MNYDALVIGAGPGGLRCAHLLAARGVRVLVLERQRTIGNKVCAGGITWSGLLGRMPAALIERSFHRQYVSTRRQQVLIESEHPIIATVNRVALGRHMAESALSAGAEIITEARLDSLDGRSATYHREGRRHRVFFQYLVGADGSQSRVRASLGLPSRQVGIGINYDLPLVRRDMVWHFNADRFDNGYAWIFPHRESVSVGAYVGRPVLKAATLNRHLSDWLSAQGISVADRLPQAQRINHDFRGWRFDRTFLVGDAAGLASPLTGEGIFPAIISAETVAETIVDGDHKPVRLGRLLDKHRKHRLMLRLAGTSPPIASLLSELSALLLRCRLISFKKFEMA